MQENKWKKWDVKKSSYWHDCSGQFTEGQYNAYCWTRISSTKTASSGGTATLFSNFPGIPVNCIFCLCLFSGVCFTQKDFDTCRCISKFLSFLWTYWNIIYTETSVACACCLTGPCGLFFHRRALMPFWFCSVSPLVNGVPLFSDLIPLMESRFAIY